MPVPAGGDPRDQESLAEGTCGETAGPALPARASWLTLAAAGLIVLAAVAAYHNSFGGTFAFDDDNAILRNETIRKLWPIWPVLCPPSNGQTVSGRPLLNLSLAINYALGGVDVRGYHIANLAIHVLAALLLFGVLRRTLLTPPLRERFGTAALPVALASTLIWTVHPLQTESITYVVQRAESLAGLFYLLALYCVIRGAGTVPFPQTAGETPALRWQGEKGDSPAWCCSWLWSAAAVLACLLGMATKEIVATAPLVVLLYDRTFLAGSFREALGRRWALYVGLAASWGLLVCLTISTGLIFRQPEMGAPDSWSYARTQPGVILYYLRLCVWPTSLNLRYEWPVANTWEEIVPAAMAVGLLVAATIWSLVRQKPYGFLGAWFFLILAPTSSFMPLNQLAHDHRMYLPLAAVAVLAVAGGYTLWDSGMLRRAGSKRGAAAHWAWPAAIVAAVVLALGSATVLRNANYQSPVALCEDLISKRPEYALARHNLGFALAAAGKSDEAVAEYRQSLRLNPQQADTHFNLAVVLVKIGRADEASEHYREAARLKPDYFDAYNNLGLLLAGAGKIEEAMAQFREALRIKPDCAEAHYNLGLALAGLGRTREAIEQYRQAVRLKPEDATAHFNLGAALAAAGRDGEAIEQYQQALRLKPQDAAFHNNLGIALAATNRSDAAIEQYRQAVRLKPDFAEAHHNLALALAAAGKTEEAIEHYQQALRLKADFAAARYNLASVLESLGRTREAIEHYGELLQQQPESPEALRSLAWLLATGKSVPSEDAARAVQLAQRARELSGRENVPCLDALAAAYAAAGRFDDAVIVAERAVQLARSSGQLALAKAIAARLELYRAGRPYRQTQDAGRY